MDIQINIPDEKEDSITDAFASQYKYQSEIDDGKGKIPNPQTKKDFFMEKLLDYIKEIYTSNKSKEAETTRKTLISDAETYTSDLTIK